MERPFRLKKNVFYFTSKALFVLESLNVLYFFLLLSVNLLAEEVDEKRHFNGVKKFHEAMKCLSMKQKYILLNIFKNKNTIMLRLGQLTEYYKSKISVQKLCRIMEW